MRPQAVYKKEDNKKTRIQGAREIVAHCPAGGYKFDWIGTASIAATFSEAFRSNDRLVRRSWGRRRCTGYHRVWGTAALASTRRCDCTSDDLEDVDAGYAVASGSNCGAATTRAAAVSRNSSPTPDSQCL
ncbi:hypothetical protein MRX96_046606 [Rhipicephalus microplus]